MEQQNLINQVIRLKPDYLLFIDGLDEYYYSENLKKNKIEIRDYANLKYELKHRVISKRGTIISIYKIKSS